MPIHSVNDKSIKGEVINSVLKDLPERKGRISLESLDDISSGILNVMIEGNSAGLKEFLPKNQPLYFLSDKEILIYANIKKIKGELKKKSGLREIDEFLQGIEKKNPDIRHNVVMSLLKQVTVKP